MSPGRRLSGIMIAGLLLLVANSAYLAAVASPTLFFYANVALHVGLGALVAVVALVYGVKTRHRWPEGASTVWIVFLLCAAVGVWLAYCRRVPRAPARALYAHGGLAAVAVLLAAAWLDRSAARGRVADARRRLATAGVLLLCAAVVVPIIVKATLKRQWQARYAIVNPVDPPLSMHGEGGGPGTPFFPSSARTNVGGTIPANFFMTSASCGRCHKEIYDQWNSSAHHLSSFNNQWYRKSIEYMQDVAGVEAVEMVRRLPRPCGVLQRPVRPADQGADRHARSPGRPELHVVPFHRPRRQLDGAGGLHDRVPAAPRSGGERASGAEARARRAHLPRRPSRIATRSSSRSIASRRRSSARRCHKVHLDVPVNGYRWFRGFNDYDNWQASGVSGQGARSFYYPAKPQKCADCHMPLVKSSDPAAKNGMVRSHRFPGANTALPFVNHDTVQLKAVQDFLRDGQMSVDVFAITRGAEARGRRERGRRSRRRAARGEHVRGRRRVGAVRRAGGR